MIYTLDSLEFLKERADYEFDINYSDPPYALGSEIIIREDGKVDYKKAVDFMDKWDMPTGEYWEEWFKEAYRTLKYGGTLIMFGMDRQLLLFKYYAQMAGFVEQQSMYWYYISGFPKATDLSKMIDRNLGVEREVVGGGKSGSTSRAFQGEKFTTAGEYDITESNSDLGKKYEGYKYSIAPLKQCNETIMIFKKPYKTGSCMRDVLEMEDGNKDITCGALDIDGNRVPTTDKIERPPTEYKDINSVAGLNASKIRGSVNNDWEMGRYPAQTFVDNGTAERLDTQSDVSKILHKCNYEQDDYDLYFYNPKVSKSERNAGCDTFEEKEGGLLPMRSSKKESDGIATDGTNTHRKQTVRNNHPTLKPIDLNYKVLKLYKTPNEQSIVYPFAGAGSEVIGGIKAGFNNWVGCELSEDYVDIAKARIEYWQDQFNQKKQIDLLKGE